MAGEGGAEAVVLLLLPLSRVQQYLQESPHAKKRSLGIITSLPWM